MASLATLTPEPLAWLRDRTPGVVLCAVLTGAAFVAQRIEGALFGRVWLEALVLAILIGTLVRTAWTPGARWERGIGFSAKTLLEIAVVLLGASVSTRALVATGPAMLLGIVGVVMLAIGSGILIGRLLGLSPRLAILVACGNAICGNSAIAAVAPVIGADGEEVAASIAFTAALGVPVVLGLPVLGWALGLRVGGYGALAGLTVYAVPQVIAAASPFGTMAVAVATLVKLIRVLMLGPVCVALALLAPRLGVTVHPGVPVRRPSIARLVPWFILGFLGLVAGRSLGLVPVTLVGPIGTLATILTVVSMAALGLGVDLRTLARAGGRVTMAVVLSLLVLGGISFALLHLLGRL